MTVKVLPGIGRLQASVGTDCAAQHRIHKARSIALLAAAALTLTGCQKTSESAPIQTSGSVADGAILGEGKTQFALTIADLSGAETHITVNTDEKTVGAALTALGLINGEEGPYGLYIKSVNGITADYDKDQTYWAFYQGEDYASASADQTEIVPGTAYALRVSK